MTTRNENAPKTSSLAWTPGMAKYLLALTLLVPLPCNSLAGQQPGDIVRVSGNLTAQFIRADSTGLHLSSGFVSYGDITSLELKIGTRSRLLEGMLIGGGIGFVAGLGWGLTCSDDPYYISWCNLTSVVLTTMATLAGSVVGTLVGAGIQVDRFAPILLPTSGLGVSNSADGRFGLALGVRLRF